MMLQATVILIALVSGLLAMRLRGRMLRNHQHSELREQVAAARRVLLSRSASDQMVREAALAGLRAQLGLARSEALPTLCVMPVSLLPFLLGYLAFGWSEVEGMSGILRSWEIQTTVASLLGWFFLARIGGGRDE